MGARELGNPLGNPLGLARIPVGGSGIGSIKLSSSYAVADHLPADGRTLLQADNPKLFAAIGLLNRVFGAFSTLSNPMGASTIFGNAAGMNGVVITVAADGKCARSTDGGATQSLISIGAGGTTTLRGVDTDGNGTWIVVGHGGFMARSIDNGVTWQAITSGFGASDIYSVAYRAGVWVAGGASGAMRRSTDNGASWSSVSSGIATNIFALASDGMGTWLACGRSGAVSRSVNDAQTWAPVAVGVGSITLNGVAHGDGQGWYLVGDSGTALFSPDSGSTWLPVSLGVTTDIYDVACDAHGNWLLCGGSYIGYQKSSENAPTSLNSRSGRAIARVGDDAWVVVGGGFYRAIEAYPYSIATEFQLPRINAGSSLVAQIKVR
jgi:photosystem II stability/assembly factor-like uncharacterized protein